MQAQENSKPPEVTKAKEATPLPGTVPLTWDGDIASRLIDAADAFLVSEIEKSEQNRTAYWKRDLSSPARYIESVAPNRARLAHILGVRDARTPFETPELLATTNRPALVGHGANYEIFAVRWPVFGGVHGEGLLLVPKERAPVADIIAVPDAEQTPEESVGLRPGIVAESQFARRLAETGCRVLIPALISRRPLPDIADLNCREYLYRAAFELGRGLVGYEVQKILAAVDWFTKEAGERANIGILGWGEGGLLALYAGALDTRLDAVCVSGYFSDRRKLWQEPIDRNVFGLLEQFGDAELASLIAPRPLIVEAAKGPERTLPGGRGAPARLVTPTLAEVRREVQRARSFTQDLKPSAPSQELLVSGDGNGAYGMEKTLQSFLGGLGLKEPITPSGKPPEALWKTFDTDARHRAQFAEIDRHNQELLRASEAVRREFMKNLDTSSPEKYGASAETYRKFLAKEVIGQFPYKLLPPNARTRKVYDMPKWTGYEVVLDVYPGLFAYGLLLVPKDIPPGEKRPVVVCQHGLEGRPQDVIGPASYEYYSAFAARLAERGFVTFAPQNLYIFTDRFRTLQRKANPLKKTLFSLMVPQHQQITDWLKTQPFVDGERIAFYGLSYGGKSAMRIPPLVSNYCLSICSADFNEWVWKNASTDRRYSYAFMGEYEIFEFDLGSTFNYAEMAALIAPRPFMVERGHFDGVAPDETVAYEFAKVRHLYAAKLGLGDRVAIEWFVGPHTINGQGTFDFLHKHLRWPAPQK
jgi:dienelactone hydrolase